MAEHLLHAKLQHWDASLRDLAARGLAKLVPCLPRLLSTSALDAVIPLCSSKTIEVNLVYDDIVCYSSSIVTCLYLLCDLCGGAEIEAIPNCSYSVY